MTIIAKNIIIGGKVEEKLTPPPKPVTDFQKLRTTETTVENKPQDQYKNDHQGDLHRLFNTKSSYLKDMLDL